MIDVTNYVPKEYPAPLVLFTKEELIEALEFCGMEVVAKADIYYANSERLYDPRLTGESGYRDSMETHATHGTVGQMVKHKLVKFGLFDSRELRHTGLKMIRATVKVVRQK